MTEPQEWEKEYTALPQNEEKTSEHCRLQIVLQANRLTKPTR